MKKFLLVLFLCFSFCSVKALTYYGDYSSFSDWQSEYIESSDTMNVEIKDMYKYYRENIIWNYYKEGENPTNYPYVNKNNYIYSDFTEYSEEKPVNKPVIESKNVYTYQEAEPVRYIKIDNIYGGYGSLRFSEISIKDGNGREIEYWYTCINCNDKFDSHVHNGIVNENWSHIDNGGELVIDLTNYYKYDELEVNIYIYDVADEYKTFNMSFYNELDKDKIMDVSLVDRFVCNSLDEPMHYNYTYRNLHVYDIKWGEVKQTEDNIVESSSLKILNVKTYYRYKDYKYYYYNQIRTYSDYMEEANTEYPNKSDEYMTYYRYQTRDKISVQDNIVITNKNQKLEDYIESTIPVRIESDINYDVNGEYNVNYMTALGDINVKVIVDIESNELNARYNELLENYNDLLNRYNNLENEYQISNNNMQSLNNQYDVLLNRYNEIENLLNEINNKYEITEEEKNAISEEYERLLNEYKEIQNNLNALEKIIEDDHIAYNELLDMYHILEEELVNIKTLNIEDEEKYQELLNQYNDANNRINELENVLNSSNSSYDKLNSKYNTLLEKYNKLNDTYKKLKEDYNSLKNTSNEYEKNINELNIEKDKLSNEYETLLSKYNDLEKNIESSDKENTEIYNSMIEEMNNYKMRINELNIEIENYKNTISNKEEEKNKITKEFENSIINLKLSQQEKINEMTKELESVETVKTLPLLSISGNYFWIFPFIVFIIMIIVLILYKKRKNN